MTGWNTSIEPESIIELPCVTMIVNVKVMQCNTSKQADGNHALNYIKDQQRFNYTASWL